MKRLPPGVSRILESRPLTYHSLILARVLRNDSTKSSKSNSRGDEIDDSSEAYVSSYQSVTVKKL